MGFGIICGCTLKSSLFIEFWFMMEIIRNSRWRKMIDNVENYVIDEEF